MHPEAGLSTFEPYEPIEFGRQEVLGELLNSVSRHEIDHFKTPINGFEQGGKNIGVSNIVLGNPAGLFYQDAQVATVLIIKQVSKDGGAVKVGETQPVHAACT